MADTFSSADVADTITPDKETVTPDMVRAPEIARTQAGMEHDIGRPFTPEESAQLAYQIRHGDSIHMQFAPAKTQTFSSKDIADSPAVKGPATFSSSDIPGASQDASDDFTSFLSPNQKAVVGAAESVVNNTTAVAKDAASAIADRIKNPSTPGVKLTPAQIELVKKNPEAFQGLTSPAYWDLTTGVRANPYVTLPMSSQRQADALQQSRQAQDDLAQQKAKATEGQDVSLRGIVSNIDNPVHAFLTGSIPSHIAQTVFHAPEDTRIAFNKLQTVMQAQDAVDHPEKYAPGAAEQAQKYLHATLGNQSPSYKYLWQSLVKSAKGNPDAFFGGLATALEQDPYMSAIPGGVDFKPISTAFKLSEDASTATAKAIRYLDHGISAATGGAGFNVTATAAANAAAGRPNHPSELMFAGAQGAALAGPLGLIFHKGAQAKLNPALDPTSILRASYDVAVENAILHPDTMTYIDRYGKPQPIDPATHDRINSMLGIAEGMSDTDKQNLVNDLRKQEAAGKTDEEAAAYAKVVAAERMRQATDFTKAHATFNPAANRWELQSVPDREVTPAEAANRNRLASIWLKNNPEDISGWQMIQNGIYPDSKTWRAVKAGAPQAPGGAGVSPGDTSAQTAGRSGAGVGADGKAQGGAVDRDLLLKLGVGTAAFTAGASMFPNDKVKGGLAAVMLAGLGAFTHGRGIGSEGGLGMRGVQEGAIRLKGEGEIHPWLTEGLAGTSPDEAIAEGYKPTDILPQKFRMVQQYLNKFGGIDQDPIKDIRLPTGERWGDLIDKAMYDSTNPEGKRVFKNPLYVSDSPHIPRIESKNAYEKLTEYLRHVTDYLRTVPESKLPQYDLVRAVRETQAWDAANAKKMAAARAKSMEGMPVYKAYPDGTKWVQLTRPGEFAQESDVMGHSVRGYDVPKQVLKDNPNPGPGRPHQEYVQHPDWIPASGDSGHPSYGVGTGGWEAIKNGSAKVYSLRDAQGNSHVTIEVEDMPDIDAEEPRQLHDITQIKGKQNTKPLSKYTPYIQDFIRSGNWDRVNDYRNADMESRDFLQEDHGRALAIAQKLFGDHKYYTKEEFNKAIEEAKQTFNRQSGKVDPELLKKLAIAGGLGVVGATVGANLSPGHDNKTNALIGASLPLLLLAAHHLGIGSGDSLHMPQEQLGAWKPRLRFNETSGKWTIPDIPTSQKNATMQEQRVGRGQEPLEKLNTPSVAVNLTNARQAIEANPNLAHDTVARILAGDHSVTPETEAILSAHGRMLNDQLREQAKIIGDFETTPAQKAAAQEKYDDIVAQADKLDRASLTTGRSWSDAGRQRMQEILHDFSMTNVLSDASRMKREATGRQDVSLTPEEVAHLQTRVGDLEGAREALQSHLEQGKDIGTTEVLKQHLIQAEREKSPTNKPHFLIRLKAMADASRKALAESSGVPSNKGQSGAIDIDTMWHYLRIGMYEIANGAYEFGKWNSRMKDSLGDKFPFVKKASEDLFNLAKALKESFRDVINKPIPKTADEIRQKQLNKQLANLNDQLRTGHFPEPKTRTQKQYNAQTQELQKAVGRAKLKVAAAKNEIGYANAPWVTRAWRRALQTRMFGILSILDIIPKLGASSLARVVLTPGELGLEQLLKQLPGVKQLAERSDYSNVGLKTYLKAEIAALAGAFGRKSGSDIVSKLKGNPELTAQMVQLLDAHPEYADPKSPNFIPGLRGLQRSLMDAHVPDNWDHILDMPGRVHDVLKTPAERGEFERAMVRFAASERTRATAAGMTPEQVSAHIADPRVQAMIQLKSFVKSLEAKFQQDARVHELIKGVIAYLGQEKFGTSGKIGQGLANFELPIVKTPVNLVREGTHYAPILGLIKAGVRAYRHSGERFTANDADYVLKLLRKQPVGVAAAVLATVFYKQFGGQYHEGNKRKRDSDIPYGAARLPKDSSVVQGVNSMLPDGYKWKGNIPSTLMHYPLMQMMTTVADMTHAYNNTKHGKNAALNAATTMLSDEAIQLPGAFTLQDTAKSIGNPSSIPDIAGRQVASLVPGFISGPTEMLDKQKRYPKGFLEQIEAKVPGLRQLVPDHPKHR